jgi:hypothetical protein
MLGCGIRPQGAPVVPSGIQVIRATFNAACYPFIREIHFLLQVEGYTLPHPEVRAGRLFRQFPLMMMLTPKSSQREL